MIKLFLFFAVALSITNCTINNSETTTNNSLVDSISISKDTTLEIKNHQGLYSTSTKMVVLCDGKQMNVVDETRSIDSLIAAKYPLAYANQTVFIEVNAIAQPKDFVIKEVLKTEQKTFRNTCVPFDFWCLGNEPFWQIQISEKENLIDYYNPMEQKTIHFSYSKAITKQNSTSYSATNKSDKITITINNEKCSDGMSERSYNYSVEAELNGVKFNGCAIKFGDQVQNN